MKGSTRRFAATLASVAAGFLLVSLSQPTLHAEKSGSVQTGAQAPEDGAAAYARHCAICHGDQRQGVSPGFPPLLGIQHQMTGEQIAQLIRTGRGRMPGFPQLPQEEVQGLAHYLMSATSAEPATEAAGAGAAASAPMSALAEAGGTLFHQNCAFCHGRDAMGGETGPDLTRSKLVLSDKTGEKVAAVVREGRPDNKMPSFNFSPQEVESLVAFLHARIAVADSLKGKRRGVDVSDLQTGNVEAGKEYFNGAGGCSRCHSAEGDLRGIASRYEGLQLEERMLYPKDAKSTVTVTLPSGEKVSGTLAYRDEFTVGLRDQAGVYRSWSTSRVRYTVDSPVEAHVAQFGKYTDADIHNLMAYLQTLR